MELVVKSIKWDRTSKDEPSLAELQEELSETALDLDAHPDDDIDALNDLRQKIADHGKNDDFLPDLVVVIDVPGNWLREHIDDRISELLSDHFGYCHEGFETEHINLYLKRIGEGTISSKSVTLSVMVFE